MWSILDWPIYRNQVLIYRNISVCYLYYQCGRSKFNFLFLLSSYSPKCVFQHILSHQHGKSAFLLQISFFCCFFLFLLSFQNAQNTQNINEKPRILVNNPWKLKSNTFLFLKYRGGLTTCQISVIKVLVKQSMAFSMIIMFVTRTVEHIP